MIAFFAGVGSFFSPCVLPLVPSFLIYICGVTVHDFSDLSDKGCRKKVLFHSVSFIVGFSFVFIALGLSSSFLGEPFLLIPEVDHDRRRRRAHHAWVSTCSAFSRSPSSTGKRWSISSKKPTNLFGSFIVGVTFSLGWTPCIGPVLASILIIAATGKSVLGGMYLLGLYSLGLAIPFFIAALLVARLMNLMRRFGHVVRYTSLVLGGLLVVLGVLLVTGYFTAITRLVS